MVSTTYAFYAWARDQFLWKAPTPTRSFAGQTIIVTGSNVGIGLEAARHFVRLDAARVILAVRNASKGEEARRSVEQSTGRTGVVEVWELDLARYESVKAFARRAGESLDRLDVVVENAAVLNLDKWEVAEGNEETITVNVVSTFLLGLLLLPKMRETSVKHGKEGVLTITGSFLHAMAAFPQRRAAEQEGGILGALAVREGADMSIERYNVSKLMEVLVVRELAKRMAEGGRAGDVVVSVVNPGTVRTALLRHASGVSGRLNVLLSNTVGRSAVDGGSIEVHAAYGGKETHGQYLDKCAVGEVHDFVTSAEGAETQKRLWDELIAKLESIQPGISQNI